MTGISFDDTICLMIETEQDLKTFVDENKDGDWILHIVPVEESIHPADNTPSVLFIRNTSTAKTYYFAFDHPDSKPTIGGIFFIREVLSKTDKVKWVLDKKAFCQMLPLKNVRDANLCGFLENNEIEELPDYETSAHILVKNHSYGIGQINRAIPLMKHKEMFDDLADSIEAMVKRYAVDTPFLRVNDITLTALGELEANGIYVDAEKFKQHFNQSPNKNGLVFSQYNVYTSTGRPSNRYGGINYAALNHSDGSRSAFISRYGEDGKIVVLDYTAFHPRLICHLTGYKIPVDTDIYEYLAKLYFKKKVVDENDIADAKQLTFRQLYGGVDNRYAHIKYLASLKTFIDEQWEFYQKNNYIVTPIFKRKITAAHIQEPSPTKIFNYILQAMEGEFAIPKVLEVLKYLNGKKTRAVLYTYDAVMYDFHREDGVESIREMMKIMSFGGMFPMKAYMGNSYHDIKQVLL